MDARSRSVISHLLPAQCTRPHLSSLHLSASLPEPRWPVWFPGWRGKPLYMFEAAAALDGACRDSPNIIISAAGHSFLPWSWLCSLIYTYVSPFSPCFFTPLLTGTVKSLPSIAAHELQDHLLDLCIRIDDSICFSLMAAPLFPLYLPLVESVQSCPASTCCASRRIDSREEKRGEPHVRRIQVPFPLPLSLARRNSNCPLLWMCSVLLGP